jgi:hypothetical protein
MLDYVALAVGLAGYLWLASERGERWHSPRFDVLRWGIALALMCRGPYLGGSRNCANMYQTRMEGRAI